MPLSAQQLAAQKNLSYVLAEKLAQRILKGDYAPGTILPGEIELGEQYGVSRTAVREAVKTLTAKGMVLPRPRIGTRVMPQGNWNFLDQELLTWWMTEENFHQVVDHFLVMRISLEPQALPAGGDSWHTGAESAAECLNGRDGRAEKAF
ncbi:Transcriptional regulator GntR family [Salmonella enterica subsp. salamae]|uniref:Transcriptional regulator GntR family n=1 Tax=Salmonella enterica subsp. salamae TaxID=59202 RepID=A0A6D2GG64_SALER|nr:Transcriptional regulator GntR family [Salmonella enterica subsp. salamae]